MKLTPIPNLSDNYVWRIEDQQTGAVAIIDPADADVVGAALAALDETGQGGRLDLILLTHHHADHIAGAAILRQRYGAPVIGAVADAHRLPPLDRAVVEGDHVLFGNATADVLETPGHTRGHISFHFPQAGLLFCGDTLFSLGCGRLLEGTAEEMFASLGKYAGLPADTLVCCGHEYTASNARFALSVDPENAALRARADQVSALRRAGQPSLPARLGDEMQTNPFLRAKDVASLAALRTAKDNFQ